MRDFMPEKARLKQYVEDTCRDVFERYCFEPMDTPALEELGLLTKKGASGADLENEIYAFKDKGSRDVGMRFDLTVPLARVVASNPALPKPFRRYQIGKVWRYDRPQKNRYREFTQADADVVGAAGAMAEFECIAVAVDVFKRLGLEFYVRLNNRKLLEDIAVKCGVPAKSIADCFRCLDKLDKTGWDGVCKELEQKGISTKIAEVVRDCSIEKAEKLVGSNSEGLKEVKGLFGLLEAAGTSKYAKFDACLARGLDYYTGTVFEVMARGISCGAGGCYDNLVKLYGGAATPAVGISFGIDRVVDVLEESGKKSKAPRQSRIFLFAIGKGMEKNLVRVAQKMRDAGINTEADLLERSASKNMEYANKKGFELVAILGEEELKKGVVKVRNMQSGSERTVALSDIAEIGRMLGGAKKS